MPELPSGAVTFRFTAIHSSTRLLQLAGRLPAALHSLHLLASPVSAASLSLPTRARAA
jgi:hypothetical protein